MAAFRNLVLFILGSFLAVTAYGNLILNPNFSDYDLGCTDCYAYQRNSNNHWIYGNTALMCQSSSAWGFYTPYPPPGDQAMSVQNHGSLKQEVSLTKQVRINSLGR